MKRNADGQFPKKYDHTKDELYEAMGFTEGEAAIMSMKWNKLLRLGYNGSEFLQRADMVFTKHELLFLFTIAHNQE